MGAIRQSWPDGRNIVTRHSPGGPVDDNADRGVPRAVYCYRAPGETTKQNVVARGPETRWGRRCVTITVRRHRRRVSSAGGFSALVRGFVTSSAHHYSMVRPRRGQSLSRLRLTNRASVAAAAHAQKRRTGETILNRYRSVILLLLLYATVWLNFATEQ